MNEAIDALRETLNEMNEMMSSLKNAIAESTDKTPEELYADTDIGKWEAFCKKHGGELKAMAIVYECLATAGKAMSPLVDELDF